MVAIEVPSRRDSDAAEVLIEIAKSVGYRALGHGRRDISEARRSLPPPRRSGRAAAINKRMSAGFDPRSMAERIWREIGYRPDFPRDVVRPVMETFDLAVILIPMLSVAAVARWLVDRGCAPILIHADRPLSGCLWWAAEPAPLQGLRSDIGCHPRYEERRHPSCPPRTRG